MDLYSYAAGYVPQFSIMSFSLLFVSAVLISVDFEKVRATVFIDAWAQRLSVKLHSLFILCCSL